MKKKMSLVLGVAFVVAIGFTSCKKDYTCDCTINGVKSSSTIENAKKGDAEDACTALETTAKLVDAAATCTLN